MSKRIPLTLVGLLTLSLGSAFAQNTPLTVTAFFADTNANWANMQDDVGRELTKRTGITLKAEFAVGDPDQKINLIAASGQYPDLIAPKGAAGVLIDADAVLDLTSLINKNAPNIKKVIGNQMNRMKFSNKNQGIYFIPNNDTIGQIYFDNDAWFKLQLQALKEQKYPRVKTLKDFEKVIADYVIKHPKTADGKPTIGLSLLADDWRFVISVTNPAFWATGGWDDGEWYIDPKTFKAMPHHFRPEEKEYFRWLNHMNDIGLLDKESFTQKYDQYLAKIASGRVVGLIDANWEIGDAMNSLKAAGKHEQMYGRFPAVLNSKMKAAYNAPTGFRGGYGIGITKAAKDPVRILKFLDYLSSDEGQVLINWGIEGKHYKVVNGKREFLPKYEEMRKKDPAGFARETGIGNYGLSLRYGDGVKDKTGNYYTTNFPDQILENYTDAEKAALKAYKVKFWGDLLPKASQFKPIPWAAAWSIPVPQDSALSEFWAKEQDITRKYIPRAILADPKDFDKIYDEMLDVMEKQLSKYNVLMTQLVQDRLKLWGVLK
ncbi:ABC transporter substrate-binding protein [Deinococcus cellulosilyticus]|uniref:ABC transporter substrate-binding protein n=1 Tax=Deinococcus cellulosilyticus (strain DSM 18568 / NBRC 106333 / KACC 11606 / 5516J-15) TaxID=1223518 RepID=A0A511MVU7_DEIC1|nr:ABC transporter substrate-binding protein [Deinococcus cellulosilyticus]GEM44694.1 ABC transporter substrate-binding protein [Deinococcus cellulosilyticus NBRC 106333 = KACC 11606]